MSFNPFGGFPTALTAIPHFAVGKFQQQQAQEAFQPQSHLQIAVTTVDASHLNGGGPGQNQQSSSSLQIQNQMLNNLLASKNQQQQQQQQQEVFVKVEQERRNERAGDQAAEEEGRRFNDQEKSAGSQVVSQQEIGSLNEYLSRFSGPPTFPVSFQPMYKYPGELVQLQAASVNGHDDQNLLTDHSSSVMTPEQPQAPKKSKKKKKRRDPLPGVPTPRRRSTSLQPVLSAALDGSTLYGCPQCHTVFQNREAIEAHLAIHRSERPFICQDCGAALKRKEHLDRHKSSHVTERPHTCPVCNKNFKRQEHLQRHSIIHRTDKIHRCTECGKGFNRKDHLTKHIHSHLAKRIKQELGTGPTTGNKPSPQQQQQQQAGESTINVQQHHSVLAQLH